jgi:hypothetical protein
VDLQTGLWEFSILEKCFLLRFRLHRGSCLRAGLALSSANARIFSQQVQPLFFGSNVSFFVNSSNSSHFQPVGMSSPAKILLLTTCLATPPPPPECRIGSWGARVWAYSTYIIFIDGEYPDLDMYSAESTTRRHDSWIISRSTVSSHSIR